MDICQHTNAQAFQRLRQIGQGNAVLTHLWYTRALDQSIAAQQQTDAKHHTGVAWCQHGACTTMPACQTQDEGQHIAHQRPDQPHAHCSKQTAADELQGRQLLIGQPFVAHGQNQQCGADDQQRADAQQPPESTALGAKQRIPQPQGQQWCRESNQKNHDENRKDSDSQRRTEPQSIATAAEPPEPAHQTVRKCILHLA